MPPMRRTLRFLPLVALAGVALSFVACDQEDGEEPATCGDWLSCYDACLDLPLDAVQITTTSLRSTVQGCATFCANETGHSGVVYGSAGCAGLDIDGSLPDQPVAAADIVFNEQSITASDICDTDLFSEGCLIERGRALSAAKYVLWCRNLCAKSE